jgi:hypothetical protein
VGLLDLRGIGDLSKIHLGEIVGARGAFHASFAAIVVGAVGRCNLIHCAVARVWLGPKVRQVLQRWIVGCFCRPHRQGSRPRAFAEPERIEQAIESFPIRFPCREQMLERRSQE